jgi:hypothetical protein
MPMCKGTKTSRFRGLIKETLHYNIIYWSVNNAGRIKHMHKALTLSNPPPHLIHEHTNTKERVSLRLNHKMVITTGRVQRTPKEKALSLSSIIIRMVSPICTFPMNLHLSKDKRNLHRPHLEWFHSPLEEQCPNPKILSVCCKI